jgi:hypothetical protein
MMTPGGSGMISPTAVGAIISEYWAASNRNGGRHHPGIVGTFVRDPHHAAGRP